MSRKKIRNYVLYSLIYTCTDNKPKLTITRDVSLTLSPLLTTQETFVDSVDQDQTAQNVQSDL